MRVDAVGLHKVGRGVVVREASSPAALTYQEDGAAQIRRAARQAAGAVRLTWNETGALVLRRGPYVIAAGLDESVPGARPYVLHGRYLNLFDPELPVLNSVTVSPRNRMLLLDVDHFKTGGLRVLTASCRIRNQQSDGRTLTFQADGIADTNAILRIASPSAPAEVAAGGQILDPSKYDYSAGLLRVRFPNSAEPVSIEVRLTARNHD